MTIFRMTDELDGQRPDLYHWKNKEQMDEKVTYIYVVLMLVEHVKNEDI